jgi:hypothetical protein
MYWFYPPDEYQSCERIVVGCYVKGPKRTMSFEMFRLSDLPNDFVGAEDLEAINANLIDRSAVQCFEQLPSYRASGLAVAPELV